MDLFLIWINCCKKSREWSFICTWGLSMFGQQVSASQLEWAKGILQKPKTSRFLTQSRLTRGFRWLGHVVKWQQGGSITESRSAHGVECRDLLTVTMPTTKAARLTDPTTSITPVSSLRYKYKETCHVKTLYLWKTKSFSEKKQTEFISSISCYWFVIIDGCRLRYKTSVNLWNDT